MFRLLRQAAMVGALTLSGCAVHHQETAAVAPAVITPPDDKIPGAYAALIAMPRGPLVLNARMQISSRYGTNNTGNTFEITVPYAEPLRQSIEDALRAAMPGVEIRPAEETRVPLGPSHDGAVIVQLVRISGGMNYSGSSGSFNHVATAYVTMNVVVSGLRNDNRAPVRREITEFGHGRYESGFLRPALMQTMLREAASEAAADAIAKVAATVVKELPGLRDELTKTVASRAAAVTP